MKTYIVYIIIAVLGGLIAMGCARNQVQSEPAVMFYPIEHASFIISAESKTIYVDPVGLKDTYAQYPNPDIILITHTHLDHFKPDLLEVIQTPQTTILGNKTAIDELGYGKTMANGDVLEAAGITVEAVPMYNLTEERMKYHPKGDGNGYVLTIAGKRIYISGDTEDIPEMRTLQNIDYAFICMNLPFTMTPEQAASAVLAMKPAVVIPYHYRGRPDIADIDRFKQLVSSNPGITVTFLDWYPDSSAVSE